MISILVTGAHGFLGRNTCKKFNKSDCYIVGIGHGDWENEDYKNYGISEWLKADINFNNLKSLNREFDIIIHCAGSGSVSQSITTPETDFKKTVDTILSVLEYTRLYNKNAKIIYPSSAAVYGSKENKPINELDTLYPVSPYGFHKKIAEELCESYSKNFNVKVAILRFYSIYGIGLKKQLIWDACNKFYKSNYVEFYGTGEETRDWLNIIDAVNFIWYISQKEYKFEILNAGSGNKTKISEVLKLISNYFDNKNFYFNNLEREGDPKYYHADISKALKLGWKPKILLDEGILNYVNWFKLNND